MRQRRHQRVAAAQRGERCQALQTHVLHVAQPIVGVALGHQCGRAGVELRQRDLAASGQRVIGAQHQLPRLEKQRPHGDPAERWRDGCQHGIQFGFLQTSQQALGLALGQAQPRAREMLRERRDQMRQQVRSQGSGHAQAQFATKGHGAGPRQLLQVLGGIQQGIDVRQQALATRCGYHAPSAALEQGRAKGLLDFLHLMRQAGRADVHGARRAVEASGALHCLYQRQIAQRHCGQHGRNHRMLHVMKCDCMECASGPC